jgi:hypothetical protein
VCAWQQVDLVCLIPFDLLYLVIGVHPYVRVLRLGKIAAYWEVFDLVEGLIKNPVLLR